MRLVSVTMTGNNEATIGEAIASVVSWVDAVVLVDTGVTDKSIEIAREIAGDKLVVRRFKWINDFAAARNFALKTGHEAGGEWAVMVDTDETIDLRGEDIRSELERARKPHFMIAHESGTYTQPRFFKLPVIGKFDGPTHEAYPADSLGADRLARCIFCDKPKTPEQLKEKFTRDVRILRAHILKRPKEARWHYYLGDALENLGQYRDAIKSFKTCADMRVWDEESAWAYYRMAQCWGTLKEWKYAVDACAKGLAVHPGIGELAWLAGWSSFKAGRHQQAVYWSRIAISLGLFRGCGADVKRILFRNPFGLWEGPYNVLHHALRALGNEREAMQADQLRLKAILARAQAAQARPPVIAAEVKAS